MAGNPTQQIDARSVQTDYSHDALGRLLTVSYGTSHAQNVSYTYDETTTVSACGGTRHGVGRLTSRADASGTTQYVYDARGNVVCKAVTINGLDYFSTGTTWVTRYVYDDADHVEEITYPSGVKAQYTRDSMGRITTVTAYNAALNYPSYVTIVSNVTYAPFGPVTGWQFRGGSDTAVRTYDRAYRPLTIRYLKNGTTPYKDWSYAYDKAGNILDWENATQPWWSAAYAYDNNNWLREEAYTMDDWWTLEYDYDANGNRVELESWGYPTSYDYDWSPAAASNRLREVVDNWWYNTPSGLYTYDNAGNPETIDDGEYEHGANGRLNWLCLENFHNSPACTTHTVLKHNADGLLAMEDWDGPGTGGPPYRAWQFHYDEGGRLLTENSAQWQATIDYIYLDDILVGYVGQGAHSTRPVWSVLTDHLGTPTTLVNSGGGISYDVHYSAYGLMFPEVGGNFLPNFNSGQFVRQARPGQLRSVWDLYYHNGYRTYDFVAGRYLQSDPIGLAGGLNTYTYAANNPLRFVDPLGLAVDIVVTRTTRTGDSISGRIVASSDVTGSSISGRSLENRNPNNPRLPVPTGTYPAKLRPDRNPRRIELTNVPDATAIQIHVGNAPVDLDGCIAPGTGSAPDYVSGSRRMLDRINDLIDLDGSGIIRVIVQDANAVPWRP